MAGYSEWQWQVADEIPGRQNDDECRRDGQVGDDEAASPAC